MKHIHGGDIYADNWNEEPLDFSANINPLGMPDSVREAAQQAIAGCLHYPDPFCRALRRAIAARLMLTLVPKKILLPAPTFAEYEEAAQLVGSEIVRFPLGSDLTVTQAYWDAVTPDIDLVVLCNPNNPTGRTAQPELMRRIVQKCAENSVYLIVDECFNDFLLDAEQHSLSGLLEAFPCLILLRAYTKMFAVPGVRFGWCMTADRTVIDGLYRAGQPWNVSVIAQACAEAAAKQNGWRDQTRRNARIS